MKTKFTLVIVLILLNLVSYSQSSLIERNRELLITMQKEIGKVFTEIHGSLGHMVYTAVETTDDQGEIVESEKTEENIPVNSEITEASYPDIYPTDSEFRLASKYGYRIDPVIIDHENGYKSYYGHLSRVSVKFGNHVIKGQIIGLSGNTGMSTGPHIHYQLSLDGKTIDPLTIIH